MEKQIINIEGKKYEVTLVPLEEVKEVEPKRISGFYVADNSEINEASDCLPCEEHSNIFRTKEQAEACIAMAQLSQLMFEANEGWVPDWENWEESKYKHVIYFRENEITIEARSVAQEFLSFKTKEIRDKFLEENKELILKAKPLL